MSKNLISIHLKDCPDFIVASLCGFCFKACEKPLSPSEAAASAEAKTSQVRRFSFHKNILAMCIPIAEELLKKLKDQLSAAKDQDDFTSQLVIQVYRPLITALERELNFSSKGCFFPGTTVNFIARGDWNTTSRSPVPEKARKEPESESDEYSDEDPLEGDWSERAKPSREGTALKGSPHPLSKKPVKTPAKAAAKASARLSVYDSEGSSGSGSE